MFNLVWCNYVLQVADLMYRLRPFENLEGKTPANCGRKASILGLKGNRPYNLSSTRFKGNISKISGHHSR